MLSSNPSLYDILPSLGHPKPLKQSELQQKAPETTPVIVGNRPYPRPSIHRLAGYAFDTNMDAYSPPSLVYYPETESEQEEDIGSPSPEHQTPTPPAARSMFDMRADWFRINGMRL
ncbi:hypothetical protein L1987_09238 [Smallanthus sonchifolius]|uniref:Uncharacterized protein n=1 Tax=Smallanthus sonchifolius TaxID=185202 RepID=A0ACB9JMV6_9ASTR|nr:hypothetical protein L1987_09238 [Smallanthus sonchifolius]